MLIQKVPEKFQPLYSHHIQDIVQEKIWKIFYEMIIKNKDTIKSDYVYLLYFGLHTTLHIIMALILTNYING